MTGKPLPEVSDIASDIAARIDDVTPEEAEIIRRINERMLENWCAECGSHYSQPHKPFCPERTDWPEPDGIV